MSSQNPPSAHPPVPADGAELPKLSERQEYILSLLVQEYIRDPQPVSSKRLVDAFRLTVSSATVRNEMGVLEQMGLIYAPHTSAGRIPTKLGYRYFVHRLLAGAGTLSINERRQILREFRQAPLEIEEWMRIAAMVLARTAQMAALVTPPRAAELHFKHLELISTQGRLVLMVLVLQGGNVHQQMLTLAEPVSQDVLSQVAQFFNLTGAMMTAEQVRSQARTRSDALTSEVGELVADAMLQAKQQAARDIYRYGLSESLPVFSEDEAQQAVRILEDREPLDAILKEMLLPDQPDIQVVVAGEGRWEDLSHLSMVLGRYGTPQTRGALGVLGPTRMRYGRVISTVRYVASLMSDLLDDVAGEK
ncbi:MAG: heat-inducible transcription repressor HrcA [Chloroflexi bacterium]|nr:heat-inducible transcription repressor HrcA [Chloroflexota bacterium]